MHDAKLGTILENACRLAGRDADTVGIPAGWKVLAGMAIEAGLNALAAEKFPQMQRVEFRRYRPNWNDKITYVVGQEVWHNGKYWQLVDGPSILGAGAPGEDGSGWKGLQPGEVARFIAFDQPWEQVVMQSFGVDTTRFAYVADPRYNPNAAPIGGCRLCELGVLLPGDAPDGVFVKFIPEYPHVDFTDWTSGTFYRAGDTVYCAPAHEVFQAVVDVPNAEIAQVAPESDESGLWRPIRVRGEFAAYLTRLVAADLLTEDQGKYQTRAAADAELERLIERYHEGNGETRVRTGRFR